jgi:hypothetical protein
MPSTIIRFIGEQESLLPPDPLRSAKVWFFLAEPNGDGVPTVCELKADAGQPPYTGLISEPFTPGSIDAAGLDLFKELSAHKGIGAHLEKVFDDTANEPPRAIGFQVDSDRADALPWEVLCRNGEFLSLDKRWPVVRVLDPSNRKLKQDYEFTSSLRIAAVLSAWGATPDLQIPAEDEWKSLEKAVLKNAAACPSQLLVMLCESDLKAKIDAAGYPNVETELITDQLQMSKHLNSFKAHILHFFCHGHSGKRSYLQLSTTSDQANNFEASIYIRPGDLRQDIDADESAWLVVLNCCDSANAKKAGATRNLCASLVRVGVPAVIGMREPVDANYARLLTEELYTELLPKMQALPNGAVSPIEWASLLVSGRKRLRNDTAPKDAGEAAASRTKHWAIPAVYMRTLAFRMRKSSPKLTDAEREKVDAKLTELRKQRSDAVAMSLRPELKQKMLEDFDQQIQAEEAKLL